jgi:hypothetical protein
LRIPIGAPELINRLYLLSARTDQHRLLRAATAVVVYRNIRRPLALDERLKRNFDEAACPGSYALTACIGFGKVPGIASGDRDATDTNRYAALVRQRNFLGKTPGAYRLSAEV